MLKDGEKKMEQEKREGNEDKWAKRNIYHYHKFIISCLHFALARSTQLCPCLRW